jgi:hypothetical protein
MEDNRKNYLESLKKRKIVSEPGAMWLEKFSESTPREQYRLINIMQEVMPVKPPRGAGQKEELPQDIKDKMRLQLIKKQYMKA